MERFAADAIRSEREAHIKAAIKANTPWTDIAERFGLSLVEIERMIVESTPNATRRGSALIVETDNTPPSQRR